MIPRPGRGRWRLLAGLWGAAEATLFFIVPDVLIGWMALTRGVRAGAGAAYNATLGALVGGAILFLWSDRAPGAALRAVEAVPAVSAAMIEAARAEIEAGGWFWAALRGPASSTPYKVYAVLAPEAGAGAGEWALAALPIRLPRFLLVGLVFGAAGGPLRRWFSLRVLAFIYAAAWIAFYTWFFSAHPG